MRAPLAIASMLVAGTAGAAGTARTARVAERAPGSRDLCARDVRHHGAPIDLDVKDADVHDVLRLIAGAGHVNVVVPDDVTGKVTLRLQRVAWDAAACTVAAVHHLAITVDGNILVVTAARR